MNMIQVESSNIRAVGYENNDLYIQYGSGTYVYKNVEKSLYEQLLTAESKGKFVNQYIKGKYEYLRE